MDVLGVFAKYWQPGRVKTRLAASVGHRPAAQIHRAFLETLLSRLADCADRRVIAFSPPSRRGAFEALAGTAWSLEPQSEGDLGRRLRSFFDGARGDASDRVVVLGSDSPTLPAAIVEQAFARLDDAPVVLGPTVDGGYYLVGIRGEVPPIFDGIAWSTSMVWEETIARLRCCGCHYEQLPEWYDIDNASDLARLKSELAAADNDPLLARLGGIIASIVGP